MARTSSRIVAVALVGLALSMGTGPLAAQQAPAALGSPIIIGKVVDSGTGKPLAYALVSLSTGEPHVITDSTGTFRFPGLPRGIQNLTASQLGYARLTLPVPVAEGAEPVEFRLFPDPIALEGIRVMGDRFRGRRNALAVAAQGYNRDRLERTPSLSVIDFLVNEGKLIPAMCPGSRADLLGCFTRRGQVIEPQVFLDEAPLIGGLSQLDGYLPQDLYLIEVIGNGLMVRAYSKGFMDNLAKKPRQLEPIIIK